MTSPGDPRRPDDTPRADPPYPAEGYPSRPPDGYGYGSTPSHPTPYDDPAQPTPPHVYNPYGNVSYPARYPVPPAGLGPDDTLPARRPRSVTLALVLLVVSAVPYLLGGFLFLAAAGSAAGALPPEQLAQLEQLGIDLAQVIRGFGVVILAIALLFVLFAVLAWTGRRWARALVAAMTAGFVLLVLASVALPLTQGVPPDVPSLLLVVAPAALAVGGVVLMFGSAARGWFARSRGRA